MYLTKNTLDAAKRGKSILLLGVGLVHALDLERHAKQAHWNVRGPHFISLHELFDQVATQAVEMGDVVAERLVALGGVADGRVETIANRSTLKSYPLGAADGSEHVEALATTIAAFSTVARDAIDQATDWGDAVTADIFTSVLNNLDKALWMVEVHAGAEKTES